MFRPLIVFVFMVTIGVSAEAQATDSSHQRLDSTRISEQEKLYNQAKDVHPGYKLVGRRSPGRLDV